MVARTREGGFGMSTAREEILNRIRSANGTQRDARQDGYGTLPRDYRQTGILGEEARLNLFATRLHDYDAVVYRCAELQIRETVGSVMAERGKSGLLIPTDLPAEWRPEGFSFIADTGLSYGEMDASQGVLTGCALAISMTGTIVLRHSPGEGRRALTLIPDYHLCVVFANQVVETVSQGIREMANFGGAPLTTISGPSATSDIEMTRIKGVHGPRMLDVILVE
jgi:L-lactate dehydrogenase complex protein LldG